MLNGKNSFNTEQALADRFHLMLFFLSSPQRFHVKLKHRGTKQMLPAPAMSSSFRILGMSRLAWNSLPAFFFFPGGEHCWLERTALLEFNYCTWGTTFPVPFFEGGP